MKKKSFKEKSAKRHSEQINGKDHSGAALRECQRCREVAAIGDIHGNISRLRDILRRIKGKVAKIIFMGDYMDRGPDGISVVHELMELQKSGQETVFLFGNHDLMFLQGVFGDDDMFALWLEVGGIRVLEELSIKIESLYTHDLIESARNTLKERAGDVINWMIENLCLYYIEKNGMLHLHAGVPVDSNGNAALKYEREKNGREELFNGIDALREMEKDLKEQFKRLLKGEGISQRAIFITLNNSNSPLWIRGWEGVLVRGGKEASARIMTQLGIKGIVFGHTRQNKLCNIEGIIFGIDRKIFGDEGGILFERDKDFSWQSLIKNEKS